MKKILTALVISLISTVSTAQSDNIINVRTGNDFLRVYDLMQAIRSGVKEATRQEYASSMMLMAAVRNQADTNILLKSLDDTNTAWYLACIPVSAPASQLMVIRDHIMRNPSTAHLSYNALSQLALVEAFPCQK